MKCKLLFALICDRVKLAEVSSGQKVRTNDAAQPYSN